ncbi:MAG: glycosyltransferase family 39 protein [Pseudomonadota bacterium]
MNRFAQSPLAPYIFFALYAFAWTVTATLSDESFHFDIQEEIAWGKEWLVGLYRHPPMKVWLLEVANQITGFAEFTPYLLSTALFGVCQLAIYLMLADVVSRRLAFFAVIASTSVYLFGTQLPLWNANTVQFAFVGLFLFSVWRALENRSALWLLAAGVFAAGGVLGKYSFAAIIAPVALWAIFVSDLRARISWGGLVLGGIVFLLLLTPTGLWLVTEGEPARQFIANRTSQTYPGLLGAGLAAGEISLIFIGLIAAPALFGWVGLKAVSNEECDKGRLGRLLQILGSAAIGSHLIILAIVIVTGTVVKDHWLMASLITVPPYLILLMYRHAGDAQMNRVGTVFCSLWLAGILAAYPLERYIKLEQEPNGKPFEWFPVMPNPPLIDAAEDFWRNVVAEHELPVQPAFVAGGTAAALVANNYTGRPSWLENHITALSPWISEADLREKPYLSIGPVPRHVIERYDLCVVQRMAFAWRNVRDQEARTINFHAVAPRQFCES